ncbi:MAG: hypothetical protein ABI432_07745 [Flavobacteriales bacterium]
MNRCALIACSGLLILPKLLSAQERKSLPDISSTFKCELGLPLPLNNPLFNSITESIGQLGGNFQFPIHKGLGVGAGGSMTWFGIKERALAPVVTSGMVRRATGFGKVSYERFTGPRTFYELNMRMGWASFVFDCPSCPDQDKSAFFWAVGTGYYVHASDNLAFGLTLSYDTQNTRFQASDLGLEGFPGRKETEEATDFQNIVFGLGFSTRLRRSPDDARGW